MAMPDAAEYALTLRVLADMIEAGGAVAIDWRIDYGGRFRGTMENFHFTVRFDPADYRRWRENFNRPPLSAPPRNFTRIIELPEEE